METIPFFCRSICNKMKHILVNLVIVFVFEITFSHCNKINQSSHSNQQQMESSENLRLKIGEVQQVTLQSRGATGLQLLARCDDEKVVEVLRVQGNPDSEKSTATDKIGGAIPAFFSIKGLKKGKTTVTFYETRSWEKDFKEIIQKTLEVEVE